jgi:hypothetical protein
MKILTFKLFCCLIFQLSPLVVKCQVFDEFYNISIDSLIHKNIKKVKIYFRDTNSWVTIYEINKFDKKIVSFDLNIKDSSTKNHTIYELYPNYSIKSELRGFGSHEGVYIRSYIRSRKIETYDSLGLLNSRIIYANGGKYTNIYNYTYNKNNLPMEIHQYSDSEFIDPNECSERYFFIRYE